MISTRVFKRTLFAGVLGFLVCSFLYGTTISKTYYTYNKAIENRFKFKTAAITIPTFITSANTDVDGVETAASLYATTSVLTPTEQDEAHDDDEEEKAINNVDDHDVSVSPATAPPSGTGTVSEQNITPAGPTHDDTNIHHDSNISRSEFCPKSLLSLGAASSSSTLIWKRLHDKILSSSYFPAEFHNSTSYRNWMGQLFQFYNAPKLRRTIAHPASPQSIVSLFKLALEV